MMDDEDEARRTMRVVEEKREKGVEGGQRGRKKTRKKGQVQMWWR
jgi:hypothetical protein